MGNFAQGTSTERLEGLAGTPAEKAVERWLATRNRPMFRFGFEKLPTSIAPAASWQPVIRHAPDYLTLGHFLEVQGTNKEQVFFKQSKLQSLKQWEGFGGMTVRFAIWVSHQDRVIATNLNGVLWAIRHDDAEWSDVGPGLGEDPTPKPGWWVPLEVLDGMEVVDAWDAENAWREKRDLYDQMLEVAA